MQGSKWRWIGLPIAFVTWWSLPYFVVVGVLHGLGHWLAARQLGIDTTFSLGTGFTITETRSGRWRFSAFPGAYVSPRSPLGFDLRSLAFLAAGPLFNAVVGWLGAVVVLSLMASAGRWLPAPIVGHVEPVSTHDLPWRVGDHVRSIDGVPVASWPEVHEALAAAGPEGVEVTVDRDGAPVWFVAHSTLGVFPGPPLPILGVDDSDGAFGRAGLKTGDDIATIDDQPIESASELIAALHTSHVTLEVQVRDGERVTVQRLPGEPWGADTADLFVREVEVGGAADHATVQDGDRLVALDGATLANWSDLRARLDAAGERPLTLELRRDGQMLAVTVTPRVAGNPPRPRLGVYPSMRYGTPEGTVTTYSLPEAVGFGVRTTNALVLGMLDTLWNLVAGRVPLDRAVGRPPSVREAPSGPGETLASVLVAFWLSLHLSFVVYNLLPLPWSDALRTLELGVGRLVGRPVSLHPISLGLVGLVAAAIFILDVMRLIQD